MVDSGCYMLVINEAIQDILQLLFMEKRRLNLANERIVALEVAGRVRAKFANRTATFNALVLPGDSGLCLEPSLERKWKSSSFHSGRN